MSVDSGSAHSEEEDIVECKRARDDGDMDKAGGPRVPKVGG